MKFRNWPRMKLTFVVNTESREELFFAIYAQANSLVAASMLIVILLNFS